MFGLNLPEVVDVIQTSVPVIQVKDRNMDMNFSLADGSVLHIEYESDEPTVEDQIRYGHYDLELYNQRRRTIHRVIVFAAGVKGNPVPLDFEAIVQSQKIFHLDRDFDGDIILQEIRDKIAGEKKLNNLDKMHIILLPMMASSDYDRSRRAWEVTQTVTKLHDKDLGHYLIGAMMGTNYNWIGEPEKSKILEVLRMAQPFQDFYQEFRKEGIKEGKREGRLIKAREAVCRILVKKFATDSLKLQKNVKTISSEQVLDRLIEEVSVAETLQDAVNAVENAKMQQVKKQKKR